jgi:endo-1,4-beta-xylanase
MTAVPKAQQFGITTWGVGDKDSYFNKNYANSDHDYPLLFNKDYKAKWAYRGFIEAGLGR